MNEDIEFTWGHGPLRLEAWLAHPSRYPWALGVQIHPRAGLTVEIFYLTLTVKWQPRRAG